MVGISVVDSKMKRILSHEPAANATLATGVGPVVYQMHLPNCLFAELL
jgi:hypothetical protein